MDWPEPLGWTTCLIKRQRGPQPPNHASNMAPDQLPLGSRTQHGKSEKRLSGIFLAQYSVAFGRIRPSRRTSSAGIGASGRERAASEMSKIGSLPGERFSSPAAPSDRRRASHGEAILALLSQVAGAGVGNATSFASLRRF